jgi:hypothetical protein
MFGQASLALAYLAVVPAVVQLVIVLIHLFESEGNGGEKKKAVLDTVQMIYSALCDVITVKVAPEFIYRVASITIDIAVQFYNLIGVFKHKDENQPENPPDTQAPIQP